MLNICATQYLLKKGIEPFDATLYMCIVALPEALSLFWGILAESVNIWGKRGHILLAASLQLIMSIVIVCVRFPEDEIGGFIFCTFLVVCGKAWMSPVIEGLMVI